MTEHSLPALFHLLTDPVPAIRETDRRRARLLAWLQLALLAVAALALPVVFILTGGNSAVRASYGVLVGGVIVILVLAYRLSRAGHYPASAWITIAAITAAPWLSVGLEHSALRNNVVPLVFIVVPVFLASMLLSAPATGMLAAVQLTGLLLVPIIYPTTDTSSWPSLVMFVLLIAVLSMVAAVISQQDLAQIEAQTRELSLSEARLREQSVRDALTGLFNRRYLEETLARELGRAERLHGPLGMLMLDIDHFKRVNDSYGHAVGDEVLRALGSLLRANVRGSDIACRYGGEEFVLLLPEASREITRQRAETIRAGASCMAVSDQGRPITPITLSVGVAAFPLDGASAEALLKSADDALYRAKREGRDRVALAG
jgi:diguanylate cyclase (GGDEF)-like protein